MRGVKRFNLIVVLLIVALLAACAPAESEPAAGDAVTQSALEETPVSEEAQATPEKNVRELDEDEQRLAATKPASLASTRPAVEIEPLLSEEKAPDAGAITSEAVTPSVVDLGDTTPDTADAAAEGEGTVVQPQPGSPNLAQTMSHHASMALAQQLDVDVSDIDVVSVEEVEWRDSSLGCPQPGMSYLTVITPGFRIILEAEGEEYEYHTDQRQNVVLCQQPGKPASGPDTSQ